MQSKKKLTLKQALEKTKKDANKTFQMALIDELSAIKNESVKVVYVQYDTSAHKSFYSTIETIQSSMPSD